MKCDSRQLTMLLGTLHVAGGEEDVACWPEQYEGSAGTWSERPAADYLNFQLLTSADASVQFPT